MKLIVPLENDGEKTFKLLSECRCGGSSEESKHSIKATMFGSAFGSCLALS